MALPCFLFKVELVVCFSSVVFRVSFSLLNFTASNEAFLQAIWLQAMFSHNVGSMLPDFMSLLQTYILKIKWWSADGFGALGEFTIEHVIRDSSIIHAADMSRLADYVSFHSWGWSNQSSFRTHYENKTAKTTCIYSFLRFSVMSESSFQASPANLSIVRVLEKCNQLKSRGKDIICCSHRSDIGIKGNGADKAAKVALSVRPRCR